MKNTAKLKRQIPNRFYRLISASLVCLLAACEAQLNLTAMELEKQNPIRRSDQFMAINSMGDDLYVVGSHGVLLKRQHQRQQWLRIELEGKPNLIALSACPDKSLIALSMEKKIWRLADENAQWQPIDFAAQSPESFISLVCGPDNSYWLGGSFSTLLSSHDQGKSWQQQSLGHDASINNVQFFDANNAFLSGEFGLLAQSQDAGKSWQPLEPLADEFTPLASFFSSPSQGWVAGLGGVILATQDGGKSWQRQLNTSESPVYGFYAYHDQLYAFADHGTVLQYQMDASAEAAQAWIKMPIKALPVYLRDGLVHQQRLIVVGGWGSLLTLDI